MSFPKRVVVTGANRNIGRAIALGFAQRGADVVISYRSDREGGHAVADEIQGMGRRAKAVEAHLERDLAPFYDAARSFLGGIDCLVNNAAPYYVASFAQMDQARFEETLRIGLSVPMELSRRVAEQMEPGGVILNISSISAFHPTAAGAAHCTIKAGLNMLTQVMAVALKERGIRVNGIAPGSVPYERIDEDNHIRKWGHPEDIAKAALYLASDEASWVSGETLVVDGCESIG